MSVGSQKAVIQVCLRLIVLVVALPIDGYVLAI